MQTGGQGTVPPVIAFVARSGTGKTTLLEKVIGELSRRGLRVGAVKHSAHGFEIDCEGKDSWRLGSAGASPVVLSSPGTMAVVQAGLPQEIPLGEIVSRFMGGVDLVVAEGYKGGDLPKIEVHRASLGPDLLCASPEGAVLDAHLVAVVSDGELSLPVPVFPLGDPGPVCDFLEKRCSAPSR